jgi:hypothetical protein
MVVSQVSVQVFDLPSQFLPLPDQQHHVTVLTCVINNFHIIYLSYHQACIKVVVVKLHCLPNHLCSLQKSQEKYNGEKVVDNANTQCHQ